MIGAEQEIKPVHADRRIGGIALVNVEVHFLRFLRLTVHNPAEIDAEAGLAVAVGGEEDVIPAFGDGGLHVIGLGVETIDQGGAGELRNRCERLNGGVRGEIRRDALVPALLLAGLPCLTLEIPIRRLGGRRQFRVRNAAGDKDVDSGGPVPPAIRRKIQARVVGGGCRSEFIGGGVDGLAEWGDSGPFTPVPAGHVEVVASRSTAAVGGKIQVLAVS